MGLTLVIMAAGVGSRYGGVKQLDSVGPSGETLMDYSIFDAIRAGFGTVVFIIRRELEQAFSEHYQNRFRGKVNIHYVYQDEFKKYEDKYIINRSKPWGTGHAMLSTSEKVNTPFAILNADDFYGASAFNTMASALTGNQDANTVFLVGYRLANTLSEYGSVSRGLCRTNENNDLLQVTELTKISKTGDEIVYEENGVVKPLHRDDLVSMNFWGFYPSVFGELENRFRTFISENYSNPKSEFYIPTFVDILIKNKLARVKVLPTTESWLGVTYRDDRARVMDGIKDMIIKGLYPEKIN